MSDWRCARCLRKPPYSTRHGSSACCKRCLADLKACGKRWCTRCAKAYDVQDMDESLRLKALCKRCWKHCRAAYMKPWRAAHADTCAAQRRTYYLAQGGDKAKAFRADPANREYLRERQRRYYLNRSQKLAAQGKAFPSKKKRTV